MGKPKAPKPPDPIATASAQQSVDWTTALTNNVLGNVGQNTPNGTLSYDYSSVPSLPDTLADGQGGLYRDADGNMVTVDAVTGNRFTIPEVTATTTLSPEQQAIADQNNASSLGLATLGNNQIGRVSESLADPYSYEGLPQGGSSADLMASRPQYSSFDGNVSSTADQMIRGIDGAGSGFSYGVRGAGGGFQYGVDGAGEGIQRGVSGAGEGIQTSVEGGGQRVFDVDALNKPISYRIGDAGNVTRTYGGDFEDSRRSVEEALLSRINPDLLRDEEALRTRLANQGLALGSEAFDRGMDQYTRQANDARYGAVLAGGQEHSRLEGLAHQRASFENAAQQQAYIQNYQQAALKQQAELAQANQALQAAGFTNQAVNDQATENLAVGNFVNNAQAQGFGQRMGAAQFGNAAQDQDFGQRSYNADLNNQARQASFGQRLGSAELNNNARMASYGQVRDSAAMNNDVLSQAFGQDVTATNLAMDATGRNNALADQDFRAAQAIFDAQNLERDRGIAEYNDQRNAPLNETAALLSGAQVQGPTFVNTQSAQLPNVNYAGLVNQNYQNELAAWQQQQASRGNLFGGLIGAAGTVGGAYLLG